MESIWQEIAIPASRQFPGDIKTDVLVIGGGMAGLLCAHRLKQQGVHCVVVEASAIAGGITKGTTAKITAQHGLIYHQLIRRLGTEAAGAYLQINQQAVKDYRSLCQDRNCDFTLQKNYIYSSSDQNVLEQEFRALQSLGAPVEFVRELPLPFSAAGAVMLPHQAQFHPLKFLASLCKDLTVFDHTPVRELTDYYAVTDLGRIYADCFIVATHFPFLNKHGSYFLKLYQQRSYVLALENAPDFPGMYLEDGENGLSFRHHGDLLLLGGGGHRTGKQGGGWAELEAAAKKFYPHARVRRRWASQDCMSLDGLPYIGRYSKNTPNLYVAAGFNKWGMTGSMAAAGILTDAILRKPNPYGELFSPSRSMLHKQLGINFLESSRNLLTPTAPRCPHLGCALIWNSQEHSWDCPCHGSRFEENGRLLDNPATGDLKKRT